MAPLELLLLLLPSSTAAQQQPREGAAAAFHRPFRRRRGRGRCIWSSLIHISGLINHIFTGTSTVVLLPSIPNVASSVGA